MQKLILALLVLSIAAGLAAQEKLTLEQAARAALEKNPDLAMDAPARAAAVSELAATRAGYLPRIDVEQSVLGGNNPVYVFGTLLTQRNFTAADFALPSLNTPDPLRNLQTRVTAQQNVWDFGRTKQRMEAAKLGVDMTDRRHEENIRQTLLAVVQTYYAVSLAHEALEGARAALQSGDALVREARARVDNGLAIESDLLRAQVYLSGARQQEILARGQGESAGAALNRLMGAAIDRSFGDTATLTRPTHSIPSEEALLAEVRAQRPDYQRLQLELRQAELDVRAKRTQFLPNLGAFATWEADHPSIKEAGGSNWIAGLSLRWNVYAGGGDSAQLGAARSRLEQKQLQVKAMESAMELEIRKALVQVRSAEQQVVAMESAVAQSEESLRILKNRYESGLATMTDLLSAEAARGAARTALARAIYQQRISLAQMEFAAGMLSPASQSMR